MSKQEFTEGRKRTTIVILEPQLQKLKILAWLKKTTVKELFDEMITEYLAANPQLDQFLSEQAKNLR